MVDGQQKTQWLHSSAMYLGFLRTMTGAGPQFIELIPERYRGDDIEETLSEADEEAQSALAFAELESGLKALSAQREPRIAGFTR